MPIKIQKSKLLIFSCLFLILLIAGFFRLSDLGTIPPGLYPDEAINGNQAITEPGKIFYPENQGREGLFINLIFLSFSVFGISIWSLKFVSALIGILTVLGLYLLSRELFSQYYEKCSRSIALLASFFLATSFWHINFSRIGFRAILVPLILTFSFYFLFRGFRTKKLWNFIIAGLIFGLGFHTYIAFRLAVLLVGIILILWWLIYNKQGLQKVFTRYTLYFILAAIIIVLPIGIYFLQNPGDFMGRAGNVSIFAQPNPIIATGQSLISHLAMFNFSGDPNWRHNISGSPILFWPIGILFLIGIFLSIKKCLASIKNKNHSLLIVHCSLLSWFFIMLLPGILTFEGIPHSLRCIGAIPPCFIFSAIGAEFLWQKIKQRVKITKFVVLALFLLFASLIFAQYQRYFIVWAQNQETKNAFSYDYVEIGHYLNSLPADIPKYVIVNQPGVLVNGLPMPAQTIMFIERTAGKQTTIYLLPGQINQIQIPKNAIIIPMNPIDNI